MNFIHNVFPASDVAALERILCRYATPGMIAVELGTYTGRSSITMLPYIKAMNGMLFCVDTFLGSEGTDPENSYARQNVFNTFRSNVHEGGFDAFVTPVIGASLTAAKLVGDNTIDFVFIDADHRYDYVVEDILAWYPKVKSGGILCGHDYDPPGRPLSMEELAQYSDLDYMNGIHFGVVRAVQELFPEVQRLSNIWFIVKGEGQDALIESALAVRKKMHTMGQSPISPHIMHMEAGQVAEAAGDLEGAVRHYLDAARSYQRYSNAYLALARVLASLGKLADATNTLLEGKRILPEVVEVSIALATLLVRQGKCEEAISHFLDALRARPADPEILTSLIDLYLTSKHFTEAGQCLMQYLEVESVHAPGYAEMAGLALQQKETRAAAIALRRLPSTEDNRDIRAALRELTLARSK